MKRLLLISSVLVVLLLIPTFALAQSTPEDLETQKRLNEVEAKRATSSATDSAAQKNLGEITYIEGTIVSTGASVLVFSTTTGSKTIYTNDVTKFINLDGKGKKLIGFGDLKIGESIMVVGLPSAAGSGSAKLIIRDQNLKPKYFSSLSRVAEIKDSVVTVKGYSREDLPSNKVATNSTTTVKKSGSTLTLDNLKVNDKVVVTGTIDEKGTLTASEILTF